MLKIGQVAEKTGISIRSLRHYDEVGLLKPSGHSESGYRLYAKDDILRLSQIVALKQMRIPLKKIKQLIDDEGMTLKETLQMQQAALKEQLRKEQAVCTRLEHLLIQLSDKSTPSLDTVYQTIEDIKMLEKYDTTEQLDELAKRDFYQEEQAGENYANAWRAVFEGLQALKDEGVEATDERTKAFAVAANDLVKAFTIGNKGNATQPRPTGE